MNGPVFYASILFIFYPLWMDAKEYGREVRLCDRAMDVGAKNMMRVSRRPIQSNVSKCIGILWDREKNARFRGDIFR